MKAIILAAGEGARMRPLTNDLPKPLVRLCEKPLLEHIVSRLPPEVNELILVVGYLGDQIIRHCGEKFFGRDVRYVKQENPRGTFHALKLCEPFVEKGEQFFVLYADDIHGEEGIKDCLKYKHALLVSEVDNPGRFGVVRAGKDNKVLEIVEKPENPFSNLVSTGVIFTDTSIFDYDIKMKNGEFYLSEAISEMAKDKDVYAVKSSLWLPIGYPKDLKKAEAKFFPLCI